MPTLRKSRLISTSDLTINNRHDKIHLHPSQLTESIRKSFAVYATLGQNQLQLPFELGIQILFTYEDILGNNSIDLNEEKSKICIHGHGNVDKTTQNIKY